MEYVGYSCILRCFVYNGAIMVAVERFLYQDDASGGGLQGGSSPQAERKPITVHLEYRIAAIMKRRRQEEAEVLNREHLVVVANDPLPKCFLHPFFS